MHGYFRHTPTMCNCRCLGAFFYWTRFILQQRTVWQYHSNLSHLFWKLGLDLELHYFWHFSRITKTSNLPSVNFMEGNILLKERTQTKKLHILGVPMNKLSNYLIKLHIHHFKHTRVVPFSRTLTSHPNQQQAG